MRNAIDCRSFGEAGCFVFLGRLHGAASAAGIQRGRVCLVRVRKAAKLGSNCALERAVVPFAGGGTGSETEPAAAATAAQS